MRSKKRAALWVRRQYPTCRCLPHPIALCTAMRRTSTLSEEVVQPEEPQNAFYRCPSNEQAPPRRRSVLLFLEFRRGCLRPRAVQEISFSDSFFCQPTPRSSNVANKENAHPQPRTSKVGLDQHLGIVNKFRDTYPLFFISSLVSK